MVKRYVMTEYPHECCMEQDDAGQYVLHDDYAYLLAENERMKAERVDLEQFRAAVMWWRPEGIPKQFRRKGDRTGGRLRAHIAEADRLLALIDVQVGHDLIGDAQSAMGNSYPLTGAGIQAALAGEHPTKGVGK